MEQSISATAELPVHIRAPRAIAQPLLLVLRHVGRFGMLVVEMFRAHIVDMAPESLTVEATGTSDKLEALLRMLEPFGIREMVQSGMVALGRGPRSISSSGGRQE